MLRIAGPLLLVAGLVGLGLGAIEYQKEEKLLDAGPLQVQTRTTESVPIPPLVAGIVAAAGAAMTAVGFRRR